MELDSKLAGLLTEVTTKQRSSHNFPTPNAQERRLHSKDALRLYHRICSDGSTPDVSTTLSALKACTTLKDIQTGRRIHHHLVQRKEHTNIYLANTLIDMYAKCRSMFEARNVFNTLPNRNTVSWNILILGYADSGQPQTALDLFQHMQALGIKPDARSFVGALKACAELGLQEEDTQLAGKPVKKRCLEVGMAVHSLAWRYGFELNLFIRNTLVDMYGKCSSMADARRVFDGNHGFCVISWNTLIMGYAEAGEPSRALEMFKRMQEEGFKPDTRTFVGALKGVTVLAGREEGSQLEPDGNMVKLKGLEKGMALHSYIVSDIGFECNVFVSCSLIDMYGKCGSLEDARRVFERIQPCERDVVAWTSMMLANAENGDSQRALNMLQEMRENPRVKPDAGTYIAALKACGNLGALEAGRRLHEELCTEPLAGATIVATCLVDFYSRCGSMAEARKVFESMRRRDLVAWNALLGGYADHGDTENVFHVFERMKREKVEPDGVTYLSLLSACSHAGLVDKGKEYFEVMRRSHVVCEIEHYSCMVDLLGRSNQLEEALELLREMPFEPNKSIWTSLLSSSDKWGNVEVGKVAFESLVRLDENGSPAYLLMANSFERRATFTKMSDK